MENQTIRRVGALIAALVGGFLLYLAADTANPPATALEIGDWR